MKKIGLTIDSSADMAKDFIDKNDISVIDFQIDLGEFEDIEGNVFKKQREGDKLGKKGGIKTSQPSLQKYIKTFTSKLEDFEEIIHLSFSSGASGAYNAAIQAKKFLGENSKRIHILDSGTGSGAQGLLMMKIVKDVEKSLTLEKIINNFNENLKNNFLIFAYDDPKWLFAGGRMPKFLPYGLQKMKEMKIGVIMCVKDKKIRPYTIKKNFFELATPLFEEFVKKTKDFKGKISVIISHGENIAQANKLKELIEKEREVEMNVSLLDIVLGSHTGPNTVVLSWQYENF
jgi:DegV family protein with EDD domain